MVLLFGRRQNDESRRKKQEKTPGEQKEPGSKIFTVFPSMCRHGSEGETDGPFAVKMQVYGMNSEEREEMCMCKA